MVYISQRQDVLTRVPRFRTVTVSAIVAGPARPGSVLGRASLTSYRCLCVQLFEKKSDDCERLLRM